MKKLKDTVEMMQSEDYKERFKAEYWQTKIRYERLKKITTIMEAEQAVGRSYLMGAEPTCDYATLRTQQTHMGEYLHDLEVRAVIEGIDLGE